MNKNEFKIYPDENLIDFAKHLEEEHKLNIIRPENYGKSISDIEQLRIANKNHAFLLTRNERHFLNIPNLFDFIDEGGVIIVNTDPYNICYDICDLAKWRSLDIKRKIFRLTCEGIEVISKNMKSGKILPKQNPCAICPEKCNCRK